jgi:hypothetical protein
MAGSHDEPIEDLRLVEARFESGFMARIRAEIGRFYEKRSHRFEAVRSLDIYLATRSRSSIEPSCQTDTSSYGGGIGPNP